MGLIFSSGAMCEFCDGLRPISFDCSASRGTIGLFAELAHKAVFVAAKN